MLIINGFCAAIKIEKKMKKDLQDMADMTPLRRKAEDQLKDNKRPAEESIHETDVKKLLHELQVHQIELEMQNEELREANATTEAALKKYTMLYDFSPMGYFTLNSHGKIVDLNFTGAEMLHEKRYSLLDTDFLQFVTGESKMLFNDFLTKLYTTNTKESCKIMIGYNGTPFSYIYVEGLVTGDERRCLLAAFEISEFTKQR